jgi:hypothetical protein
MSPWLGSSSSARWGAARGASGLAKIPPLWAALRRLPPTASSLRRHSALTRGWTCARAGGSAGCSTTFHGRLGAGVTISIDAVPSVFNSGLLSQHPICYKLFNLGRGLQGHSAQRDVAAATTARIDKAVQEVYERFETACDDLDSGLFDADDQHCYCCMQFFDGAGGSQVLSKGGHVYCRACSYQVHGWRGNGGKHTEFATTARPNDRCPAGCSGCSY